MKYVYHKTYGRLLAKIAEEAQEWYNLRLMVEADEEVVEATGVKYVEGEMLLVYKKHVIRVEDYKDGQN